LFGGSITEIVVSPEKCFTFHPDQYPLRHSCLVSDSFRKHYYPKVGELDDKGEEFLCAQFIDQMEEVEFWVRNLERQESFSFWLQTSTDKFYPDFVCKLKDGRYLVVEYKGADRWSNDDSKENVAWVNFGLSKALDDVCLLCRKEKIECHQIGSQS
jgi:type III restriction enzyme